MIHWGYNALCPLGQQCVLSVCGLFPWLLGPGKKKPRRCNKSPFTPSFVKLPPCAAAEGFSLRLTEDNTNSFRQLSRNNVRFVLNGRKNRCESGFVGVFWLFFFRCRERLIKLRGKPQSSLNAHTAARQQPYLHLFACLRVSILSQCRRNWDDSFYVITSEASEMSGGTQDTHWEGDLLLWNLPRLYVV